MLHSASRVWKAESCCGSGFQPCARDWNRTSTFLRTADFESDTSTNTPCVWLRRWYVLKGKETETGTGKKEKRETERIMQRTRSLSVSLSHLCPGLESNLPAGRQASTFLRTAEPSTGRQVLSLRFIYYQTLKPLLVAGYKKELCKNKDITSANCVLFCVLQIAGSSLSKGQFFNFKCWFR